MSIEEINKYIQTLKTKFPGIYKKFENADGTFRLYDALSFMFIELK